MADRDLISESRPLAPPERHKPLSPAKTKKFKGWKGLGFNGVFVPIFNALPTSLTARWGWHLMIYATK